jgi:hypothetical protein
MNDQNKRRRLAAQVALVLGVAATVVPQAAAEPFVPGVTDFGARPAFTPGVTDFPARPADVDPASAPPRVTQVLRVSATDGFDWADAGVGAGAAAAAALAAAAAAGVGRTRRVRHG